ncbi:MAG: class I SAM-dependent methyltransferase [Rhodothermales bacterium]|nr:class I SAM-dependent methyltransferase [Rhodothermales bacterium]
MSQTSEISEYYDRWVPDQVTKDVNLRHLRIFKLLKEFGLARTDRVLEIGCGIGQVSSLILSFLKAGSLTATDISPASIDEARRRNAGSTTASFVVSDMTDFETREIYNVIVLPDVLEHIPIDKHADLFALLFNLLADDGFVFIHIPHPRFLAWKQANEPESLQVVDQVLHSDELLARAYSAGFYVERLQGHSIFSHVEDYQYIVLRKDFAIDTPQPKSKYLLGIKQLLARLTAHL